MEQTIKTDWKKLSREERGKLIFENGKIAKKNDFWVVDSQTSFRAYKVRLDKENPRCNCPDCELSHKKCKHIYAVEYYIKREIDEEGKITETRGVRVTYGQQWSAYNKSQLSEKLVFMRLLRDLCNNIENPVYDFGRPTLPFSDMIFASVMKVYTKFSLRRFMSDMQIAKQMNLIDNVPCYSTISNFMNKEKIKSILEELIILSSTPLREVETDFAIDSSGFSTCRFARWYDYKWGKERKFRVWLKAHVCIGTKTNICTAVRITERNVNDSPQLLNLVEETAQNFKVGEVSCDKAYSSRDNLKAIENIGAVPYIPFKKNVTGKRGGCAIWKKMYHYFLYKHDEFLEHYHKRSNVESYFNMVKTKFGDSLMSKKKTAQEVELLCKILSNNITIVIQEVNELGVKAEFNLEQTRET